jgi:hypothetical protein
LGGGNIHDDNGLLARDQRGRVGSTGIGEGLELTSVLTDGARRTTHVGAAIIAKLRTIVTTKFADVVTGPDWAWLQQAVTTATLIASGTGPVTALRNPCPATEHNKASNFGIAHAVAEARRIACHYEWTGLTVADSKIQRR